MISRQQLEEPSLDPGRAVQDGNWSSSKAATLLLSVKTQVLFNATMKLLSLSFANIQFSSSE